MKNTQSIILNSIAALVMTLLLGIIVSGFIVGFYRGVIGIVAGTVLLITVFGALAFVTKALREDLRKE